MCGTVLCVDSPGSEANKMDAFLGPAVLVGLLRGMTQNGINLVNAPLLAQEQGVTLSVTSHPDDLPPVIAAAPEAVQVKVTRGLNTHILIG